MLLPVKVVEVELSRPIVDLVDLEGYGEAQVLIRLHGEPVGYVRVPVINGRCPAQILSNEILDRHSWAIIKHLIRDGLSTDNPGALTLEGLVNTPHPSYDGPFPLVTVSVCTRDRTEELAACLVAVERLRYPRLDILVVDNAPSNESTKVLVESKFPKVRYVLEPRPGLDWARNRAIQEARGEILAFTDDDVIVDSRWVQALVETFEDNPGVMAVTGLVAPYELETDSQILFEKYGGFGRGFDRRWFHITSERSEKWEFRGAGKFGTGANMAFRRDLFNRIGPFDPALDVGTVTNGGGDLEMFYRVLKEGFSLVYEPGAIVFHRHRRDYGRFKTQITNNGIGFYSYLVRSALAYSDDRVAIFRFGVWWFLWWSVRRLILAFFNSFYFPRDLILAEMWGSLAGLGRYRKARRAAAEIQRQFGVDGPPNLDLTSSPISEPAKQSAVRIIDLRNPVQPLTGLAEYQRANVNLMSGGGLIGMLRIRNHGEPIGRMRLCAEMVDKYKMRLIAGSSGEDSHILWAETVSALRKSLPGIAHTEAGGSQERLPDNVPVSIVIATRDRSDDLQRCLEGIFVQDTHRKVEVVVVDNYPDSGLAAKVLKDFPQVILVEEKIQGLSYARNRGIAASSGEIVVTTDDDVAIPPDWLEKLLTPFSNPDVMVVTGNILPLELETKAQEYFESYGGLGRGFEDGEFGREWFEKYRFRAVPTWDLGATANAAFRSTIFSNPEIGMMDETLGVGTPTGCSEDTYLYYKVLKAGYKVVYRADACLWHRHRRDMKGLRRQIFNYSKGHVAYQLLTLFQDRDLRAFVRMVVELPLTYLGRVLEYTKRKSAYPLFLILFEIAGNLSGPLALLRSLLRVRRIGKSAPYVPVGQRIEPFQKASLPIEISDEAALTTRYDL